MTKPFDTDLRYRRLATKRAQQYSHDDRCQVIDCDQMPRKMYLCSAHYQAWKAHGDPLVRKRRPNGEGTIKPNGYRALKRSGRRILAHRFIVEETLGRKLPAKAVIHHVNGDGLDNRLKNLVVCNNNAYHHLLHRREQALDACGHPDWRKCIFCKQYDDPRNMYLPSTGSSMYHRKCSRRNPEKGNE